MERFAVEEFDKNTYQIIDRFGNFELCRCNNFEGHENAKHRAKTIAASLNLLELLVAKLIEEIELE
jgi:hypothetical protein